MDEVYLRTKNRERDTRLFNTAQRRAIGAIVLGIFGAGGISGYTLAGIISNNERAATTDQYANAPYQAAGVILNELRAGQQVLVSNEPNILKNKEGELTSQPLVFQANNGHGDQTYFAFFNTMPLNLNQISNSDALDFMTILPVNKDAINPANTEEAHLNRAGNIVDPNGELVAQANYLAAEYL